MAKGIENHTVSLTKNGYHKLKDLISAYPANQILQHLGEIALDRMQALKMLAGNEATGAIPDTWNTVKDYTSEERNALLMISIIFSHKDLIRLFQDNTNDVGLGAIRRTGVETKTYTNLAYAMNELGLAVDFQPGGPSVSYDWNPVFAMSIGPLVKEILQRQLESMGWREPRQDELFTRSFYEQAELYGFNRVFGLPADVFENWLAGGSVPSRLGVNGQGSLIDATELSWRDFLGLLATSITEAGLKIDPFLQQRFVMALLTKPFVILTGLAGSGKTKLAQAFAHWICEDESQICMVPVGADWTNREPLLGYPNALEPGSYCKPDSGVLNLLLEAAMVRNSQKPYFLILDEMNLSHVERYFADILSAMESKEAIPLRDAREDWKDDVPVSVGLPPNLFIIGTVNIDETTYMFSPKVLDRAQVIEFRITEEEMVAFLERSTSLDLSRLRYKGSAMGSAFVGKATSPSGALADANNLKPVLREFFKELKLAGAEFGYRTATEILRFISFMNDLVEDGQFSLSMNQVIDVAILQKLLPKVHGSRRKIESVLEALAALCLVNRTDVKDFLNSKDPIDYTDKNKVKYPLSLEKIVRMYKRAIFDGFTSYAEA